MSQIACCREDLAVPVVLADDEQDVARAEERALVDVRLDPVEREPPYRRVEVDDAEGDADDGADRQPDLLAGLLISSRSSSVRSSGSSKMS